MPVDLRKQRTTEILHRVVGADEILVDLVSCDLSGIDSPAESRGAPQCLGCLDLFDSWT